MCIFKDCIWPKTRSGKLGRTVEEVLRHIHRGGGEAPRVCWAHAACFSFSLPRGTDSVSLGHLRFRWLRGPADIGAAAWPGKTTRLSQEPAGPSVDKSLHPLDPVPAPSLLIKRVFMCHRRFPCVNQLNHHFAVFQPQIANIHQQTGALLPDALEMCGKQSRSQEW